MSQVSSNNYEEIKRKTVAEPRTEGNESSEERKGIQASAAGMFLEKTQRAEMKDVSLTELMKCAENLGALKNECFYIIAMEYFCRTIDDNYIPAELGLIKYSLKDGVVDQLHMHINPGKIPRGLNYQAHHHAEETHHLPVPPNALGLTDYQEIADKLLRFIFPDDGRSYLLFTHGKEVHKVENMLRAFFGYAMDMIPMHVCSLSELFLKLQEGVQRYDKSMVVFRNSVTAQQHLDLDCFSFTSGLGCNYHQTNQLLNECALSRCMRWAYTISANCCRPLGIKLIPGRHCPDVQVSETELSADSGSFWDEADLNHDRVSFVSYGTDGTSLLPGEVEVLESDVQSTISDMGLAAMESLNLNEPKPDISTDDSKSKEHTRGGVTFHGESKKYVSSYPMNGYTYLPRRFEKY
uniref:Maelstrom domain-containing protein n=1 Tax=Anopheles minimus TaxID=112268 RepID=A0A182WQS1_9DIPT